MTRHVLLQPPLPRQKSHRATPGLKSRLRSGAEKTIFAPYALRLTPYARAYQTPRLAQCREPTASVKQLKLGLAKLLESQARVVIISLLQTDRYIRHLGLFVVFTVTTLSIRNEPICAVLLITIHNHVDLKIQESRLVLHTHGRKACCDGPDSPRTCQQLRFRHAFHLTFLHVY